MNSNPGIKRRDFLKSLGICSAGYACFKLFGIDINPEFQRLIPAEKNLDPAWVKSLFERGERETYYWHESKYVGMPVGGICCGQIYLGSDGKLWHWDIFNRVYDSGSSGLHYANPMKPESPLEQGFAISIKRGNEVQLKPLDHTGWEKVRFTGEYPIGYVEYEDPKTPVKIKLEAFSPFIPLNPEDSALPATIFNYTVTNVSTEKLECEIGGWLENAVCINSSAEFCGVRKNQIVEASGFKFLNCVAEIELSLGKIKPDIIFDDFESGTYGNWEVRGESFGRAPIEKSKVPSYQGDLGGSGNYVVNSHASAPGKTVEERDSHTGELLSREFVIERDYITFLVGGGAHKNRTCVNLLIQGKSVLSATGKNNNRMSRVVWNVKNWRGLKARIQVIDSAQESWGNIGVDHIVFTDNPSVSETELKNLPDFGSMGLAVIVENERDR
ncbi:MAG: GH116 family glycosyl-hydrolase, partial [Verrucomicrobiae bacterium]|nr:GH116 family glycosyl-hydrolase [Verrucomicrobiae bacterium]